MRALSCAPPFSSVIFTSLCGGLGLGLGWVSDLYEPVWSGDQIRRPAHQQSLTRTPTSHLSPSPLTSDL